MKAIVIGTAASVSMDRIMEVFPRHKALLDAYVERGEILGIGPFADRSGSMAIFSTREAAERFVAEDPFVTEGILASYVIHEWGDTTLAVPGTTVAS